MYFSSYNEPPEGGCDLMAAPPAAVPPVQTETAPPTVETEFIPPQPPEGPVGPPRRLKPKRERGERGAVAIILTLVLVLGAAAVLLGLQWQRVSLGVFYPGLIDPGLFPGIVFETPKPEVEAKPNLRQAPTGDGTVLTLVERGEMQALTLQEIYEKVNPSIVSVTAEVGEGRSEGTGVIMSADGYIITNAHVIEGSSHVEISLESGRSYEGLLVGRDEMTDLAVLKIRAKDLPAAEFGNSDRMKVGDTVAAIGNPLGKELRGTMTDGILSAVSRDMEVDGNVMTLLQTTAALNSGNSGGALVNDGGQVVGITNMKLVTSGFEAPIEGLGFAIPSVTAKTIVDSLIATGHVEGRPVLGVTVRTGYIEELEPYGTDYGLAVIEVSEGSDAWAQGIRPGDVILTAEGTQLYTNDDLLEVRAPLGVGDAIVLTAGREGKTRSVTVKLVEAYLIEG